MTELKDFYYIYTLVGTNYIKPVIQSFQFVPKEANIVIVTNTPEILKDVKVDFNLIISDLESLRDDWSKEHEYLIQETDDQKYMDQLRELYKENYKFPMGIMRYGMKWAIENNITKFALVDCGVKVNYVFDPQPALDKFNELGATKNLLFGSPMLGEGGDFAHLLSNNYFKNIFTKYNVRIDNLNDSYLFEWKENYIGDITFDGWIRGFWFNDIKLIKLYFNLWNDITKQTYNSNDMYPILQTSHWIQAFEWVSIILNSVFSINYNTMICGTWDIAHHIRHPEIDFFAADYKMGQENFEWVPTETRDEFLKINREKLLKWYGPERAKDIVYGWT